MGGFSNFGLIGGYRKPSNINFICFLHQSYRRKNISRKSNKLLLNKGVKQSEIDTLKSMMLS